MATSGSEAAEEATISILKEDSGHVELAIRIRGLQPKKGIAKLLHRVKKAHHPQDLVSNASFTRWILTSSSLEYEAKIKQHQSETTTSKLRIRKFPSEIDDHFVEVRQPPGRNYSFLIIRARKRTPTCDWKRFLNDNATLDACSVDEESQAGGEEKAVAECPQDQPETETGCGGVYSEMLKKSW